MTAAFTKPSDEIIKLFTPVLDWLDAGAEHGVPLKTEDFGFDMAVFIQNFDGKSCGTSCCLGGALQSFNNLAKPAHIDSGMPAWREIVAMGISVGLTQEQCLQLFFAADGTFAADGENEWPNTANMLNDGPDVAEYSELDLDDIKPAEAAITLRRFLETGEIKWEIEG